MEVSYLQYADDIFVLVKMLVETLWTIKEIIRGFELASNVRVIIHKINLIKINIDLAFQQMVEGFLHCKIESLIFQYLGLPVGAKARLESTWKPLLNLIWKILNTWPHMYASLGGKVILFNTILNIILVFFLSFLKMPMKEAS